MTTQEILFGLTFVYGVLQLISYTKLFTISLSTISGSIFFSPSKWLKLFGYWFLYFSLFYQSVFWAKYFNII